MVNNDDDKQRKGHYTVTWCTAFYTSHNGIHIMMNMGIA